MSALSQLRRALLTGFATEEELDRIGRNLGVSRLPGMGDETYRCVLQTLPYLPKPTVYGLQLLLECLFPGGGATVYEDLVNFPGKVFILISSVIGGTSIFEGKAFMAPTGADVTPPVDPAKAGGAALGRGGRQLQTSSTTSTVTVAHTPVTVVDVLQAPEQQMLEMTALPSAASPAWTFVADADSAPTEANIFSLAANGSLQQVPHAAPSDDHGYYKRSVNPDEIHGAVIRFGAWWRATSITTVTGRPWALRVDDAGVGRRYGVFWRDTSIALAKNSSTLFGTVVVESTAAGDVPPADGTWSYVELERRTVENDHLVSLRVNGRLVFSNVNANLFDAGAADEASFGAFRTAGATQNWTVQWDRVTLRYETPRNHWNITRRDGVFSGANDSLTSAAGLFVAGDVGRKVRVWTQGTSLLRLNLGLWRVKTFVSATEVVLEGVPYTDQITVSTALGVNYVDNLDPWFIPEDVGKRMEITTSALGNNRTVAGVNTVKILEVINPRRVRVDGAAFVSEVGLNYQFIPYDGVTVGRFAAATGVQWELVAAGSFAAAVLTVRDLFPLAASPLEIEYTKVLSAQILRNEAVVNAGAAGSPPNVYYPFYVFDVDRATRQLVDEITAAGVIPAYAREF